MLHNGRLFFLFTTLFLMPRKCLAHESFGLVAQLCLTLCNPMDCRLPGSSIMGFSRQEYWSGVPCPSLEDLPDPGI